MKRIGIVGGLGPDASLYYYRLLIDLSHGALEPGKKYPDMEILLYNLDQNKCANYIESGRWTDLTNTLIDATERLYRAGADFAIIACITVHIVFNDVKAKSPIPLLSAVEETCKNVASLNLSKVGLLGTRFTMQSNFFREVFSKKAISLVIPKEDDQIYIHSKTINELVLGIIKDDTRAKFLEIIQKMVKAESIQGLILGCTELPLLIKADMLTIPMFDTSMIHAQAAFNYSLSA